MHRVDRVRICMGALVGFIPSAAVFGDIVVIPAAKDNTLYLSSTGNLSNGAGDHFFVGRPGFNTPAQIRRGLIAFDVAGNVPSGSTLYGATLTLYMSRTPALAGPEMVTLTRLLSDWGEGSSHAAGEEGTGAPPQPGDATWIHTFFSDRFWTTPGGDFAGSISAGSLVDGIGFYTWGPTPEMTADVQSWLDASATNFGWIVRGNEVVNFTSKRFDTHDNVTAQYQPTLRVCFTPPGGNRFGDLNCDGTIDTGDVAAFALAVTDPVAYAAQYPACDSQLADMNCDGRTDGLDLRPFVTTVLGGG